MFVGIMGGNTGEQFAFLRVTRLYRGIASQVGQDSCLGIEPELGLAFLGIRTVAMKAIVRQNGSDIPVEGEPLVGCPCMPAQRPKAERQEGMENIFFQGGERVARILISLNKPSQWQRVGLFVILDKFALGKAG